MNLSLFYFAFVLFILLPTADQTQLSIDSCPTSRRLLFFGRLNFSIGEKKSEHTSTTSKASSSTASAKATRPNYRQGPVVYIRPQTSAELGKKVRSYGHLLTPKLLKNDEQTKPKKLATTPPKKNTSTKKSDATQRPTTKTRELVVVNDDERDRCIALLRADQQTTTVTSKAVSKKSTKTEKNSKTSNTKNAKQSTKKKTNPTLKDEKQKPTKVKPEKSTSVQKKKNAKKTSEIRPLTPVPAKQIPIKGPSSSSVPPTPSPPSSPASSSQSSTNTKSKKEKTTSPKLDESTETSHVNEPINNDSHERNNSVVDRAYHFVRNMFQLSDDILENNDTHEEDRIFSSTNEEPTRQSRKLLSINDPILFSNSNDINDCEFNSHFNEFFDKQSIVSSDDLLLSSVSISKRQLLSVKNNKRTVPTKMNYIKSKKHNSNSQKLKVGWAYRYRISRYLSDQKMKRPLHKRRITEGGKSHPQSIPKKASSSMLSKFSKRKLLQYNMDDGLTLNDNNPPNQDIVNTVSITQKFVPKRQLFNTINTDQNDEEESDDETDSETMNERRRMKSYEEITDPEEIVRSYDQGLFKPRVGWQFRYRVSRYIDALRENIREDQERLKLGLDAIKRKTPQELSGRRKRVLDKPFASEVEEKPAPEEDNKPHAGWRYRYRISKMLEAKQRGEYVDDEEEKRKQRLKQKGKREPGEPADDDDECVEWEYDILDPELRKIGPEGRRVGWAYRYRISRKLDALKKQQEETGVLFDWETLSFIGEKETTTTSETVQAVPEEAAVEVNRKAVGWKYRYRVSKMQQALEREAAEALARSQMNPEDQIPIHERLDPELARLTAAERMVGWQYRYRIRRKLDAIKTSMREIEAGKRKRKGRHSSDTKADKEKIIKKVEESIEKILNIDDIDETPFMEYFRRTSSYIFFGLLPTGRKSICLLPLPITFKFCNENAEEVSNPLESATMPESRETPSATHHTEIKKASDSSRQISSKKTRAKKEKHLSKQNIPSRSIKSNTGSETVLHSVESVLKSSAKIVEKLPKKQIRQRLYSSPRYENNEQVKHFDEEELPIRKIIAVESQRNKNKKRFQIIGTHTKPKPKATTTNPTATTTTATSTPSTPVKTKKSSTTITSTITDSPSPPQPEIVSTTTHAPLRSTSEILQEEAATLLSSKSTNTEEVAEEANEATENVKTRPSSDPVDDSGSNSSDSDTDSDSDSDSSSNDDTTENDEDTNSSPMNKIRRIYENAKQSMHDAFDLHDEKGSS